MRGVLLATTAIVALAGSALAAEAKSTGTSHELTTTTPIAVTSASTAGITATFVTGASGFRTYRIICDQAVHAVEGTNPTATNNDAYFAAEAAEYRIIRENYKIAFKTHGTTSGTCWITRTQQ